VGSNLGILIRYAIFDLILDRIQATLANKDHPVERVRLETDMIKPLVARGQQGPANRTSSHLKHLLYLLINSFNSLIRMWWARFLLRD
jgi:hypothetical protein